MQKILRTLALLLVATLLACHAKPQPGEPLAPRLQSYVDDRVMAGAVFLVADKNEILSLETLGLADVANNLPMRDDTLFWIASMTKPMTAAAVMILVDEGKISLDDPLEKFIPEFANVRVKNSDGTLRAPTHPPTLREALSHTAGMEFLNRTDRNIIDAVPLVDSIAHNLLEPLRTDPGVAYHYSNEGIDAAGFVVQIVSSQPFETFLKTRLLDPLGMTNTTFSPSAAQLPRLAKSYKTEHGQLVETPIHFLKQPLGGNGHHPAPGGGLFSTARDVAAFCQMLLNNGQHNGKQILSPDAVGAMTTRQTPPAVSVQYGLGLSTSPDGKTFGHDGLGLSTSPDGKTFGHDGAFGTSMIVNHGLIRIFLVQQAAGWSKGNALADLDKLLRDR